MLGHLVELIANMPFDAFLEQRIFTPLHMTDTGFYVPKEKIDRFAALYSPADNGRLELTDPPATGEYSKPPSLFSGGGGLVSTTTDYVQFAQMVLNGGELDGTRLLGRKTIELMTTNHIPDQLMPLQIAHDWVLHGYGYGLGFGVIMNVAQSQVLGSSNTYGWGGAASTHFWIDPKEEWLGVIMTQFSPIYYYPIEQQFKVLTYQALVVGKEDGDLHLASPRADQVRVSQCQVRNRVAHLGRQEAAKDIRHPAAFAPHTGEMSGHHRHIVDRDGHKGK